jgi:hypothetical protein
MDYFEAYTNTFDALRTALARLSQMTASPMKATAMPIKAMPMTAMPMKVSAMPMSAMPMSAMPFKVSNMSIVEHFELEDINFEQEQNPEAVKFYKEYGLNIDLMKNVYKKFELPPDLLNENEKKERLKVLNAMLNMLHDEYQLVMIKNPRKESIILQLMGSVAFFVGSGIENDTNVLNSMYFIAIRMINLLIFEMNRNNSCPTLNPKHGPSINTIKNFNKYISDVEPYMEGKTFDDLASQMGTKIKFKNNVLLTDATNSILNFNIHPSLLPESESKLRIQTLENFRQMVDEYYNYEIKRTVKELENVLKTQKKNTEISYEAIRTPAANDISNLKSTQLLMRRLISLFIIESQNCKTIIKPQNYIPITTKPVTTISNIASIGTTSIPTTTTLKAMAPITTMAPITMTPITTIKPNTTMTPSGVTMTPSGVTMTPSGVTIRPSTTMTTTTSSDGMSQTTIIIIVVVIILLLLGGGAAWYFYQSGNDVADVAV